MKVLDATDKFLFFGWGREVKHFDLQSGECCNYHKHDKEETKLDVIAVSEGGKLAAASFSDKTLVMWKNIPNATEPCYTTTLAKRATAAVFHCQDNVDFLYVADKSGDLYKFGCNLVPNLNPILGHVSMLLDVKISSDGQYIFTSDRDEKIRVSFTKMPFEIQSFCLGHREFVCNMQVFKNNTLISSSGDGTINVWNILQGAVQQTLLFAEDCEQNTAVFPSILRKSKCEKFVAVASEMKKCTLIKLYSFQQDKLQFLCNVNKHNLNFIVDCELITLNETVYLVILGCGGNNKLLFKKFEITDDGCIEITDILTDKINENIKEITADYRGDELLSLFKATFNKLPSNGGKTEKRGIETSLTTDDVKKLKTETLQTIAAK